MTIDILNPATQKIVGQLPIDTTEDIAFKLSKAKDAGDEWKKTSIEDRQKIIINFSKAMAENITELAKTQSLETGKPAKQAQAEINGTINRIKYFLDYTPQLIKPETVFTEGNTIREELHWEPLGVIANISAWNYPWFVGSNVFIPALLTGNTVLYKPSEFASLTGQNIKNLWEKSGLPNGVFQMICGAASTGDALINADIDGLFFTGSWATGRAIIDKSARKLIPIGMELGGKDPAYCTDDINIKKAAAAIADGAFYNCGQSCCAVERIYVHTKIYREFISAFTDAVKQFKVGDPLTEDTYLGPLTRPSHRQYLNAQIEDAVGKGAKIALGNIQTETDSGFFNPVVLTNTDHDMDIMQEESFGPIIGIQEVSNDENAINLMNDSRYGLTSSVYCNNIQRAEKILSKINTGSAYVNCCDRISPYLPWSGRGDSGLGSTLGSPGIRAFVQPKSWHIKSNKD
tara:strand:+ start:381 stop:1760 length:1380 start_codon:yes stop_codon:yes gene_type:complete